MSTNFGKSLNDLATALTAQDIDMRPTLTRLYKEFYNRFDTAGRFLLRDFKVIHEAYRVDVFDVKLKNTDELRLPYCKELAEEYCQALCSTGPKSYAKAFRLKPAPPGKENYLTVRSRNEKKLSREVVIQRVVDFLKATFPPN